MSKDSIASMSDKAQAALARVVARFQAGDLSPLVEVTRLALPESAPAARWSFNNRVLAYVQTLALDCRGFRQWQEAGRQVKKGAHASYILRPKTVRKEADGETVTILVGVAPVAVFAITDTEPMAGQPDTLPDYAPATLPPLYEVAGRLGIGVAWEVTPPDRLGGYSPARDAIRLGTHEVAVWFHELAHAGHKRVLGKLIGGQDPHQESVAELTAAVLMELYGVRDHTGNAWQYISAYHTDPLKAICQAVADVGAVLAVLLDREL